MERIPKKKKEKTFINFQILSESEDVKKKVIEKFKLNEKEWDKIMKKIKKFRKKILKDLNLHEEVVKYFNELRKQKPEVLNTLIYHLAVGSSFKLEEIQSLDLEGEDSILKYIEKLLS